MRLVIQRVKEARVKIKEETVGEIGRGLLVFLGIQTGRYRGRRGLSGGKNHSPANFS